MTTATNNDLAIVARILADIVDETGDEVFLTLGPADANGSVYRASLSSPIWGGGLALLFDPVDGSQPLMACAPTPAEALKALAALLVQFA